MKQNKIINGKQLSLNIIKKLVKTRTNFLFNPKLVIIKTKKTKEIDIYIKAKKKISKKLKIKCEIYDFSDNPVKTKIIDVIQKANKDKETLGIIYQFPDSNKLNSDEIIEKISPKKDIDGFHKENLERLFLDKAPYHISPTCQSIDYVLRYLKKNKNVSFEQKICSIISKKSILISSLVKIIIKNFKFLILIDQNDKNFEKKLKLGDVVISCIDKPNFIKDYHIKKGAILIDVGTVWYKNRLQGTVDFNSVYKKVKYITPVPGGIGPLTVAFLFKNLLNYKVKI